MKMAKWIIAISVLLLAACGSDEANTQQPQDNNHGYGYHYTDSNADGLRLRAYGVKPSLFGYLETAWSEITACAGLPIPRGPLIIAVDSSNAHLDDPAEYGHTFIDTGTILVGGVTEQTVKDAMLHVLLKSAGFDDAQNMAHAFHGAYSNCL